MSPLVSGTLSAFLLGLGIVFWAWYLCWEHDQYKGDDDA